ncbi:unnamed protein product [Acanthoscelides obtectus]|uniref:Uncharacterized protein n=1 Tax=Acanthoscelides obtectus TaxID=200917 RepID=A0A9P0KX22_ACAOB|nr:unnamed protein product [Acanthoscelides obtectus]CAK1642342.1 hypothetical protein AOBTE_LOCUS12986 [Acanthoscelides obtectus]
MDSYLPEGSAKRSRTPFSIVNSVEDADQRALLYQQLSPKESIIMSANNRLTNSEYNKIRLDKAKR